MAYRLKLADLSDARPVGPRERRRRAVAVGVSLGLHAVFLIFGFGAATGALVSGGGGAQTGDVRVVSISLAGSPGAQARTADPQADRLAFLYREVRSEQSELSADNQQQPPHHETVQSLFAAIDAAAATKGDPENTKPATAANSHGESADVNASDKSRRGDHDAPVQADGPGASASVGAIWGQIEPCWRSMPDVSRVPVTLEITLNDRGGIAVPPKIVRPDISAPNEQRLVSEARALAAIAACVPYHSVDLFGDQRRFTVRFMASHAGG